MKKDEKKVNLCEALKDLCRKSIEELKLNWQFQLSKDKLLIWLYGAV